MFANVNVVHIAEMRNFMAEIKPFICIRPSVENASRVAALPYDVYNRKEAKEAASKDPLSFLNIDRPETQFADDADMYADEVYEKAAAMLWQEVADGIFVTEQKPCYFVYELIMDGRHQTGIAACASIDDYLCNVIKKHENTREEKEQDRIRHVDTCGAQTGPIFLAYRSVKAITDVVEEVKAEEKLYGFTSSDGITHNVWKIEKQEQIETIRQGFQEQKNIYIADGHHRAASAVKVGLKRRAENPGYNGTEEFNYFLAVLFPQEELKILPYHRVVKDLNKNTPEEFLEKVSMHFSVEKLGTEPYAPEKKGTFGMYLNGCWYRLNAKEDITGSKDPVEALDVTVLQKYLIEPVLGIEDARTDKRIDFVGGIRGLKELERRADTDMKVAFSMYPTSIEELFAVSDEGRLMPPKSTWFEPKLRSGLFIHKIS